MSDKNDQLAAKRHSLAHLLAAAVMELYPDTKRTIGPAIDDGFYFDFEFSKPISEDDFPKIEKKMREILPQWSTFERHELSAADAKKEYPGNQYKHELIDEFTRNGEKVTFYKSGDYWDLCKGGHVENMTDVDPGSFKLYKLAGAYWRGDEKNPMLTRIYSLAFNTKKELDAHLAMLEEAKKRDHRKLGQELDLFVFSDMVGAGLPLFTPRGTIVREALLGFSEELQLNNGFQKVAIPHITKQELYEKSGHWAKFGHELFLVKSQETSDQFVLKPMNCPHHTQIYAGRPRSYRDLPIRYMESTMQYRDEKKGEINGLSRVRGMSIDDAHIFCRLDQIDTEFETIMGMIKDMYGVFEMKFRARLSFRDESDKYLGDPKAWAWAQSVIEDVAKKLELDYVVAEGEAAFYGPKIDVMVTDALGREWQCATEQLDFVQPQRFGLVYTDEAGKEQTPVMIHKALLGTFERFLSVYIEHTAGRFPVWVSPEQVRVLTVNQEVTTVEFANKLLARAKALGVRLQVDNSNESVGKKIREAELWKVPYVVVVGEKEVGGGELLPRVRSDLEVAKEHKPMTVDEFLKTVAHEAKSRVNKSSL